jgi:hypothetical protein
MTVVPVVGFLLSILIFSCVQQWLCLPQQDLD